MLYHKRFDISSEQFDRIKLAVELLKTVALNDKTVLADRAYGSDDIRTYLAQNIVERFFGKIKQYRYIATRYDKLSICFWNFIALAAIKIQLK